MESKWYIPAAIGSIASAIVLAFLYKKQTGIPKQTSKPRVSFAVSNDPIIISSDDSEGEAAYHPDSQESSCQQKKCGSCGCGSADNDETVPEVGHAPTSFSSARSHLEAKKPIMKTIKREPDPVDWMEGSDEELEIRQRREENDSKSRDEPSTAASSNNQFSDLDDILSRTGLGATTASSRNRTILAAPIPTEEYPLGGEDGSLVHDVIVSDRVTPEEEMRRYFADFDDLIIEPKTALVGGDSSLRDDLEIRDYQW